MGFRCENITLKRHKTACQRPSPSKFRQQKTAKPNVLAVFRGRGSRNLPFAVPEKVWHIRRCATFSTAAPAFHDLHPPPAAVAQATHSRGFDKAPLKAKAPTICRCFRGRGSRNRTHDTRFWRPLLYLLSYTPM